MDLKKSREWLVNHLMDKPVLMQDYSYVGVVKGRRPYRGKKCMVDMDVNGSVAKAKPIDGSGDWMFIF